jgi:hypothetical protein
MSRRLRSGGIWAGVLVALAFSSVTGQQLRYSGSVGYATGYYDFAERTSTLSVLNGLALVAERWSLSATVPIAIQNSDGVSYIGGIAVPTGTRRGSMGRRSTGVETTSYGVVLGDPVLRASFSPYRGFGALRLLELQAMAKAPVADPATGVGTGQWDVGGGVSAGFGAGRTYFFAEASAWSPGDLPDLELKEYGTVAVGVGQPLGSGWSGLLSVSVSSAMIDGISPPASLNGGLSYSVAGGGAISVGAGFGLTDSAPDISVYLGWSAGP